MAAAAEDDGESRSKTEARRTADTGRRRHVSRGRGQWAVSDGTAVSGCRMLAEDRESRNTFSTNGNSRMHTRAGVSIGRPISRS